jgi:hypothetical protein
MQATLSATATSDDRHILASFNGHVAIRMASDPVFRILMLAVPSFLRRLIGAFIGNSRRSLQWGRM